MISATEKLSDRIKVRVFLNLVHLCACAINAVERDPQFPVHMRAHVNEWSRAFQKCIHHYTKTALDHDHDETC